jgi:hypothetical protein
MQLPTPVFGLWVPMSNAVYIAAPENDKGAALRKKHSTGLLSAWELPAAQPAHAPTPELEHAYAGNSEE